jgi:Calpain family cysteine protease
MVGANWSVCRGDQSQKNEGFRDLFATLFSQWDGNHDGVLDLKELNAVIENPNVRGSDAAVAVYLHRQLQVNKEGQNGLSLAEVLALASDPQIQKNISGKAWRIAAINHSVFAPGDPNLATFHQGGIGDCYLLAVIGALAFHHPEMVRTMIQQTNGGFQVRFGNGRTVSVGPLTDAELIMGASEGRDHGVWLSVLEKACAQIDFENKERKIGTNIEADEAVMTDFIGHGGYYAPVMTLFSGHRAAGAPLERWVKQDPRAGIDRAHELLAKLSVQHKLMAVATGGNKNKRLPKGIPHGHVLAVLGYDPVNRMVVVFNPWGNHFTPKGEPGLVNGYRTDHGIFDVPLNEFIQIFSSFTYETDRPAIVARY